MLMLVGVVGVVGVGVGVGIDVAAAGGVEVSEIQRRQMFYTRAQTAWQL